ncbi:MAG TPA: type VI secretion system-associated FHA domain protein TagH [Gammaproteobacteria bacterium]|nr:type VI secretion system-associated FHA domain protein TagH [Gammaproteobacteria bacterium]
MALRLTILSQHARSLGERATKEFGHGGGTLGRSLECDWALPDGQRFLSSRHASIDYRSGTYYIVDTSTNGVFVNGADQPVGRGKPQRLFNGDKIRIGDYEIGVEIDGGEETTALTEEHHIDPVDLAQRVEDPEPTNFNLVDETEITGIGIEELLTEDEATTLTPPSPLDHLELVEDTPAPKTDAPEVKVPAPAKAASAKRARAASRAARPPTKSAAPASTRAAAPSPAPASAPPAAGSPAKKGKASGGSPGAGSGPAGAGPSASKRTNVLDAFFRGAGVAPQAVDAKHAEAVLLRLGQLMREMIVGVSESLHLRAEQKNALRLPNTTIQQRDNNPLKFSPSVEEMLTHLLFRDSKEYLSATEAVREAYADLRLHQQSLLKALRVAIDTYTSRFDPDDLEQKFSRGRSGGLIGAANKLKYWDLYKDVFQLTAQHPPGELPAQFLDDFAEAYEAEMARAAPAESPAQAQAG